MQGSNTLDIFAVHDKTRTFIKKILLCGNCIENEKYNCFEILEIFIVDNQVQPKMNVVSAISTHLSLLKINFEDYFGEKMDTLDLLNWICNQFQDHLPTGILIKASK